MENGKNILGMAGIGAPALAHDTERLALDVIYKVRNPATCSHPHPAHPGLPGRRVHGPDLPPRFFVL